MSKPSTRKGYERSTDPIKPLDIDEQTWRRYQRQATQGTLRSAVAGSWPGSEIVDVLEMLGLITPAPLATKTVTAAAPEAAPEPQEPRWCGKGMHAMVGDNVYRDPLGRTECRRCRRNRKTRGGAE